MSKPVSQMSRGELEQFAADVEAEYANVQANRMALDLSRGKPAADQLALSNGLEDTIAGDYTAADGTDTRNYGGLRGLPEARELGAELLGIPASAVMAAGNSSLSLMHLVVSVALRHGLWDDARAWQHANAPTLLAPVPGYDRHFALSDALGIDLHTIDMTDDGPDLAQAQAAVADNPDIKGIWCVPKYSNPTGCVYSDRTVEALAELPKLAAADDFVVLWDNAYAVHDLAYPAPELASIHAAAQRAGTADHIVQFASTSKITMAGAGVAFVGAAETVLKSLEKQLQFMTIGPDKVNQLRHSRFLQGRLAAHMQQHAALLQPKFKIVLDTLSTELGSLDIARWTQPKGGYFVSLDTLPGLATEVVSLSAAVGLTLTPAGATFPYSQDPADTNVRIAPTFANLHDLDAAMQVLTLCIKVATARQLLARGNEEA